MTTDTPTLHDLLEVSAAIGAETGGWRKHHDAVGGWWRNCCCGGEISKISADRPRANDKDAQVGRLVKHMTKLGWHCCHVEESDGMPAEFVWLKSDARPENDKRPFGISCDEDYTTAVYLAAKKVEEAK